jgi:hypothetical protein
MLLMSRFKYWPCARIKSAINQRVRIRVNRVKLLFSIVLLSACGLVHADTNFSLYLGAGGGSMQVDAEDAFAKDVQFKVGEVLAGVRYKWVGIETRLGQSLEDEAIRVGTSPITLRPITAKTSIDEYQSTYLRLQAYNQIGRVYLLYGQTSMTTVSEFSDGAISIIESEGDSYALGAGFQVNERLHFNVEAKNLLSNDTDSFAGFNFTIDYRVL